MSAISSSIRLWHLILASFLFGIVLGTFFFSPPRLANTTRVEACLKCYISLKKSGDTGNFNKELAGLQLSPEEFQRIIDRFLHFRIRKSALDQAMKLLQAFQNGSRFAPSGVSSQSDAAESAFELDAEILTVFKEKPELINEAFGG